MRLLDYELLLNEDFLHVLRDVISEAKRRIYIASYIASLSKVTKDIYYAIAERARNGVDVKIVLNGVSEEALKFNRDTTDFLASIGIKNVKLTGVFTHVKLYIVDDYFIIGSHNLSGSPLMNRVEVSLMIHSKEMSDTLSELFTESILKEDVQSAVYRGVAAGAYYEVLANYAVLRDFFQKTKLSERRAKILMYIATLSKATKRYYNLLAEKAAEGVEVAVLLNGASNMCKKYNELVANYLKAKGVERVMLSKDFVHAKLLILDDIVILGSHNLTSASIAGRMELSVAIMSNNLANALDSVFEELWAKQLEKPVSGEESDLYTSSRYLGHRGADS